MIYAHVVVGRRTGVHGNGDGVRNTSIVVTTRWVGSWFLHENDVFLPLEWPTPDSFAEQHISAGVVQQDLLTLIMDDNCPGYR